jgi:hypothetical protein
MAMFLAAWRPFSLSIAACPDVAQLTKKPMDESLSTRESAIREALMLQQHFNGRVYGQPPRNVSAAGALDMGTLGCFEWFMMVLLVGVAFGFVWQGRQTR